MKRECGEFVNTSSFHIFQTEEPLPVYVNRVVLMLFNHITTLWALVHNILDQTIHVHFEVGILAVYIYSAHITV